MPKRNLDAKLAKFLRKQRGETSYSEFARKIGVGHMTARRLESGEHHITLRKLETILDKLKARMVDVFPGEFQRAARRITISSGVIPANSNPSFARPFMAAFI